MKIKVLVIVWVMSCVILNDVLAEQNINLWLRGTITAPITPKFKTDFEFQHRRQNGFDNHNPFDLRLMNSIRIWSHYQFNEKVRFTISPFSYFSNFRAVRKLSDEMAEPRKEFRFGAAVELQNKLAKNLYLLNREFVEYRVFQNGQNNVTRLRNRMGLRYQVSKKTRFFLYDELMVNLSGISMEHFFDHNRLGFNIEQSIAPSFKVELQYMYATRLPLNNAEKFSEHNFLIYFSYTLPQKKKEIQN